jgi:hypothetical protein
LARKNDARGLVNLGYCLHTGLGTGQNQSESMKYFKAAVEFGDAIGQFNYGMCCYKGEGIALTLLKHLNISNNHQIRTIHLHNLRSVSGFSVAQQANALVRRSKVKMAIQNPPREPMSRISLLHHYNSNCLSGHYSAFAVGFKSV